MANPAENSGSTRSAAASGHGRTRTASDAAEHLSRIQWAATLLPPAEAARAAAELAATGLAAAAVPCLPAERDEGEGGEGRHTPPAVRLPDEQLIPALRAAATVEACDALLDAAPVDWDAVAAAHALEPFGRTPSRGLIARRDCPDALTAALLTPWHPQVANRLAARQKARPSAAGRPPARWHAPPPPAPPYELPDTVRHLLLPWLSRLRVPLLRLLLTADKTREVVRATTRLDRLVAAVDRCDRNHVEKMHAFWDTVGAELRAALEEDPTAWRTAAERLPRHQGSLRQLLDGLREPVPGSRRRSPDLRVLAQAPPKALAAVLAGLDDKALEGAAEAFTRPNGVRMGGELLGAALARVERAGVPPRRVFAHWAHTFSYAWEREPAVAAWLYGLDGRVDRLARTHPRLRRRIAAAQPERPAATDLVAELRANPGPVQAQLVLDATCADDTPWTRLVEAHTAEPLPESVLWVLAARPGFPTALLGALPTEPLSNLAGQGPEAARMALANLPDPNPAHNLVHCNPAIVRSTIHRVRSTGVLDDRTVLATARPAGAVLLYGSGLSPDAPDRDSWNAACAKLLTDAASRSGPGFWHLLANRLPTFKGTLPELLAPQPGDATVAWLYELAENPVELPQAGPVPALLERYETQVRAAIAHVRPGADAPSAAGFPDREAALHWLDCEWATLPVVARVASTLRPGLTIELPRLLDRYLDSRGRIAELIPLAEMARQTAARVGDRQGEALAWANLGVALNRLRRYDEAVPVNEQARALMSRTGDHDREGRISRNLGTALWSLRRYPEAIAAYDRARILFRGAGLPVREGNVCRDLARTLRDAGRMAEAAAACREAVALFGETGRDRELGEAKRELSRLTLAASARPR
ncbi:tetratricopeptide repeat protein [Streptomyces sp. NPDC050422]|uniref:tetratricopeptide repeat protein n=1 Tax=Streptomyces sp. NPDC050422 TaxID=3365614 RepID=UPI0037A746F0